jgi:hypothetical protein
LYLLWRLLLHSLLDIPVHHDIAGSISRSLRFFILNLINTLSC